MNTLFQNIVKIKIDHQNDVFLCVGFKTIFFDTADIFVVSIPPQADHFARLVYKYSLSEHSEN